jgi:hypothetical protein
MGQITYGLGGFRPAHPSKGKVEEFNDATSTVTTWDDAGTVTGTRPYTAAETSLATAATAERTARTNRATIEQRAAAFITATNTYLAIPTPSNAQVAAQVRRNAQATIGLVKIALNLLADTNGTG